MRVVTPAPTVADIAISAGLAAGSVALVGFGLHSMMEVSSGLAVASLILTPLLSWARSGAPGLALGSNAVVADSTQTLLRPTPR